MATPEWVGWVAGGIIGLVLAVLVQPLLEDPSRSLLVRLVGRFNLIRPREDVDGKWMFVWWKDGSPTGRESETPVRTRTVGARVAGKFEWKGRSYQLIGSRHTPDFVSGTYVDTHDGYVFHGAFQLRVFHGDQQMSGRWVGFRHDQSIAEDPWYLRRADREKYTFEEFPAGN